MKSIMSSQTSQPSHNTPLSGPLRRDPPPRRGPQVGESAEKIRLNSIHRYLSVNLDIMKGEKDHKVKGISEFLAICWKKSLYERLWCKMYNIRRIACGKLRE